MITNTPDKKNAGDLKSLSLKKAGHSINVLSSEIRHSVKTDALKKITYSLKFNCEEEINNKVYSNLIIFYDTIK